MLHFSTEWACHVLCWLQIFDYVDSSLLLRQNTYIMLTADNGEGEGEGNAATSSADQ
jgi:hypothetical protein